MKNEMEEKKLKSAKFIFYLIINLAVVIIVLPFIYLVISMGVGTIFGIKLPQPFSFEPRATILSNPLYDKNTTKEVSPEEIQKLLDKYPYGRPYQKDVFDCSDMSIITARLLQEEYGYDTSVVGDALNHHAWVYVWMDKNKAWAIETVGEGSLFRGSGGDVMGDDWWDTIFLGHWLEPAFVTKGYELYYPTKARKGLKIVEWNEVGKYFE